MERSHKPHMANFPKNLSMAHQYKLPSVAGSSAQLLGLPIDEDLEVDNNDLSYEEPKGKRSMVEMNRLKDIRSK